MDKKVEQLSSGAYLIGFEESLLKGHYPVLYKSGGIVWVSIYANKTQQQPPIIEEVEPQQPIMEATQPQQPTVEAESQQPTVEAVPQPQAPVDDDYFLFTPEYFAQGGHRAFVIDRLVKISNYLNSVNREVATKEIAHKLRLGSMTINSACKILHDEYKVINIFFDLTKRINYYSIVRPLPVNNSLTQRTRVFGPQHFTALCHTPEVLKRMVNICNFLVRNPRSTALQIAKALGVKQSTLSNTIYTLIHVYRFILNSTPGDGTHAHYSISENGFTKLKETK